MAAGMTKTQLVRHLAEKLEVNNKTAAAFLENLADTAIKETKKSGVFVVPGIGRLVKAHRKARVGRNPNAPETDVPIPQRAVVKFKPGKEMREAVAKLSPGEGGAPASPGAAAPAPQPTTPPQ